MADCRPGRLVPCQDLAIYETAEITEFSLARGISLCMGIVALQIATRPDMSDPMPGIEDFRQLRTGFSTRTGSVLTRPDRERLRRGAPAEVTAIRRFRDAADTFDGPEGFTRDRAVSLATAARRDAMPAISRIMVQMQKAENERQSARDAQAVAKAAMMDALLRDMKRIGRMIGMISINASVEAARAGGESGRSFKAIADEVRTLAQQSSELVDRMQLRMADDSGEDVVQTRSTGRI